MNESISSLSFEGLIEVARAAIVVAGWRYSDEAPKNPLMDSSPVFDERLIEIWFAFDRLPEEVQIKIIA